MFATDPGTVIAQGFFSLVDSFGLTGLVFLRRGFGERFLTPFKYGLGIAILTFLMALRAMATSLLGGLAMLFGGPLMGMMAGSMLQSQEAGRAAHRGLFDAADVLYWAFILCGGFPARPRPVPLLLAWSDYRFIPRAWGNLCSPSVERISHGLTTIVVEPTGGSASGAGADCLRPQYADVAFPWSWGCSFKLSAIHQWRSARDERLDEVDARIVAGFLRRASEAGVVEAHNPDLERALLGSPTPAPRAGAAGGSRSPAGSNAIARKPKSRACRADARLRTKQEGRAPCQRPNRRLSQKLSFLIS